MSSKHNPNWRPVNLANHHYKRITKDADCWEEIFNRKTPMTENEYESISYEAYAKGVLEYEAEEERHRRAIHRLDARSIKTTVSLDRKVMITCFHFDAGNRHVAGTVFRPLGDQCGEFLDVLEERALGGEMTLFDIKADKKNIPKGKLRSKAGPLMTKISSLKNRLVGADV